jgi:hypothetical protein
VMQMCGWVSDCTWRGRRVCFPRGGGGI